MLCSTGPLLSDDTLPTDNPSAGSAFSEAQARAQAIRKDITDRSMVNKATFGRWSSAEKSAPVKATKEGTKGKEPSGRGPF
jgi:hypothetical protein